MRHRGVRVIPAPSPDATAPSRRRVPIVRVAHIDVAEAELRDGRREWPMVVTFSDGTQLPSRLADPNLLADYLDYLQLPDDVVSFTGNAHGELWPERVLSPEARVGHDLTA